MKIIPHKIIINLIFILFLSACHTLEHNGFAFDPVNKLTTIKNNEDEIIDNNKNNLIPKKKDIPSKKSKKIQKVIEEPKIKPNLNKSKKSDIQSFNPKTILNLSEKELFKKMGKSDFVKHEGKLKNHQYYLTNCFVDFFLVKKESSYFVNFIQRRPIKLNGFLNEKNCFEDISKKIKNLNK